jgi:hypothetical protein
MKSFAFFIAGLVLIMSFTLVGLAQVNQIAQSQKQQETSTQTRTWYQDANWVTAAATITAVLISVFALVISIRTFFEQRARELREEFRVGLEKLVDIRSEIETDLPKITPDGQRIVMGQLLNTKRLIYLAVATSLEPKVFRHITYSEYNILALEYRLDEDYVRAEKYLKQGTIAAYLKGTTLPNRITAYRALGDHYYLPSVRDFSKGREAFQIAIELAANNADEYVQFCIAHTYVNWAKNEATYNNFREAENHLKKASDIVSTLKALSNQQLIIDERCRISQIWRILGERFFSANLHDEGTDPFKKAKEVIYELRNDTTCLVQGQNLVRWADLEENVVEKKKLYVEALEYFKALSNGYPNRIYHIENVKSTLGRLSGGSESSSLGLSYSSSSTSSLSYTILPAKQKSSH